MGVTKPLHEAIDVGSLPSLMITAKDTPPEVIVRAVVGGGSEALITLDEFRSQFPLLRSKFAFARELLEATSPGGAADLGIGPSFDELLEFASEYVDTKVEAKAPSERRDIGIYYWTRRAIDVLETAIRDAPVGTSSVPIPGDPEFLDTANYRRKTWTGITYEGKKCHLTRLPCHTDLEVAFAKFLDGAGDVVRYMKNEFFGFSVTYYENSRPRQYFPDFIVVVKGKDGGEVWWLAETKGEIRASTALKREAAQMWCEKMTAARRGEWRHLFVPQKRFEGARANGIRTFANLAESLVRVRADSQLSLIGMDDARVRKERYKTLLPVYSLKAAAGYFGKGEAIEPEGWVEVAGLGPLDEKFFVARIVGRSMEPRLRDGDYGVFRAEPEGSRQGRIVLVQWRGVADPESGGSFSVKKYTSEKVGDGQGGWRHSRIVLQPLNPDFRPIAITEAEAEDFKVVAEYVGTLNA